MESEKLERDDQGLIQEFYPDQEVVYFDVCGQQGPERVGNLDISDLEYNSSWGWLMPVVEKIEKDCECNFEISGNAVWVAHSIFIRNTKFKTIEEPTKKESVFKAVVEFIKWHNTQNK